MNIYNYRYRKVVNETDYRNDSREMPRLKKTLEFPGKIAALTPCPAKTNEFRKTNVVSYNITFKKLGEHLKKNGIKIPQASFKFDSIGSPLTNRTCISSCLLESIRRTIPVKLRVNSLKGYSEIYRYLELMSNKKPKHQKLLDALNCINGCSNGAGCNSKKSKTQGAWIKGCLEANVCESEQNQLFSIFNLRLKVSDFMG